ncbi:E3 ubiquitin-protein ligase MIB2-like [Asterias amurensis]|uniref:E3 ubiquitin-protein ligase MIB2-like n=1 Tax=Asterias amurensis TaxID=7602 RepID=UPI003AB45910
MLKGLRVVRGRDWRWDDQDGGKGSVGTVVPSQVKERTSGAWVRWDSGKAANYRAGGTKFDLRIFDNAQVGVKHPGIMCDVCDSSNIVGIRWKCKQCHDYDLCHICYNEDKHDLTHCFSRIDAYHIQGVEVPPRSKSTKCKALGMFPGARVMRGPDWEWKEQDGGEGTVGVVCELDQSPGSYRSWVKVQWPSKSMNSYRCGKDGKMDLRCSERETCGEFYIDHLPNLDGTRVRPYVEAGDKVRLIDMDYDKLKELQTTRCGWKEETAKFRGKVGEVTLVDKDGDIKVDFGGSSSFINPQCLIMEERKCSKSSEDVQVKDLGGLLEMLVKSQLGEMGGLLDDAEPNGGAVLFHAAANGKTEKVKEIIKKNPSAMKYQNPAKQTPLQVAAYRGHTDSVIALVTAKAPLESKDDDGDTALMFAVIGKEPEIVKFLLLNGSNINASNEKGLTALHLAAAKGHPTCAEVLLKHEPSTCNVNIKDNDGNTPLMVAFIKKDKQITSMLLRHPKIDLKLLNKNGFNSLHFAAIVGNSFAVDKILEVAPGMINLQKDDGFTALHLAALNDHIEITTTLVKRGDCNKELKNENGQTALHLAVTKSHNKCIEALVNNGADVNAKDKDGDTSLHLVMVKASMKDILGSSDLGQLMELINRSGGAGESKDEKSNLVAIAIYLIKNGADIHIKDHGGRDVIDVTLNPAIKNLLREQDQKTRTMKMFKNKNDACKVS